jgi:hypothetical protein
MNTEKESNNSNGRGGARQGAGRPKGSLDKGNALIRELIVEALDNLGGTAYLEETARSHPAAFLSLLGKVMPVQVTGADGGSIKTENHWTIEVVEANAKADAS